MRWGDDIRKIEGMPQYKNGAYEDKKKDKGMTPNEMGRIPQYSNGDHGLERE